MMFRLCTAIIIVASISYNSVLASQVVVSDVTADNEIMQDAMIEKLNRDVSDVTIESTGNDDDHIIVRLINNFIAATKRCALTKNSEKPVVYNIMSDILANITALIKNEDDVNVFIKAKGLDNIIYSNLKKSNHELRGKLIMLTKTLLETAPEVTKDHLALDMVKPILYLLEKENPANKAHIIDILSIWLPGNPLAQKEVMQNGGFRSFDKILPNSGTMLKVMMMSLLNNIINEHEIIMHDEDLVNSNDWEVKMKQYADVNLFEALSLGYVCEGFGYLFHDLFQTSHNDIDVILTTSELMDRVLSFCKERYIHDRRVQALVKEMGDFFNEEENLIKHEFVAEKDKIKKIVSVVKKYAEDLVPKKDEL